VYAYGIHKDDIFANATTVPDVREDTYEEMAKLFQKLGSIYL